jgi:hypothetical protein
MLEMPRKAGGKMISHLLAAHGGEIFVHTLVTARSVLEDPPSISEGCGGRVTDYRITVRHIICVWKFSICTDYCNRFESYTHCNVTIKSYMFPIPLQTELIFTF